MKKLLILGGIAAMTDIVVNAKNKGYYTIVTDYLEDSPAKKYADESWMLSIDDVEGIVARAKAEHIDGVMNYCIDPGQKPYQQICEKMSLPCIAGYKQFEIMTNKDIFSETCRQYGISVIKEYNFNGKLTKKDLVRLEYPLVVKPVDGRASKGFRICTCEGELSVAISYALRFSKQKRVIIQKYMNNCPEICVKFVACDGEIFLSSMSDVFSCFESNGTRVYLGTSTYPSRYYCEFINTTNDRVINMLKGIGIENGAISLTGFYDNGDFLFFDPSLRMGGAQDWRIVNAICGVDISGLLTNFAMTGSMGDVKRIRKIDKCISTKYSALLYFDVRPGVIGEIKGIEKALSVSGVVGFHQCHKIGDAIVGYGTTDNVALRFIIVCNTQEELIASIYKIQECIKIKDIKDQSLIAPLFDPKQLL